MTNQLPVNTLLEVSPMIAAEEMKNIKFLRSLGETYLNQVSGMAVLKECAENAILFRQGQESHSIYFILSGTVGLQIEGSDGHAVEVSRLGPGELLGWSPVLGQQAMTTTARTVTRCRLAALDARQLDELCHRDTKFGTLFLREVALVVSARLSSMRWILARALLLIHGELSTTAREGSD